MLKKLILLCMLVSFISLPVPLNSQAQDDSGLSEEELAWLDRYLQAPAIVEEYEQYTFDLTRTQDIQFFISFADNSLGLENLEELELAGQVDNIAEIAHATVSVETFYNEFEHDSAYSLNGEIIIADKVAYAQAEYTDTVGDIPALPENWQLIETQEDIPPELGLIGLEYFFEGNLGFIPLRELIRETASQVTYEENILQDGTPVEIITILIEGENFATFMDVLFAEGTDDGFFELITLTEDNEGYIDIWVAFNAAGHLIHVENFISVTIDEIDLADIGNSDFPEGTTVKITADLLLAVDFHDINSPIDAIERPVSAD